ncbi:phage tail protein [Halodesulfovibrio sp.]|jgi:hypothetical protein|uniref:phage tail protein n=1 Tax=Halodesulfovibrio sp. TaxID=1912772 RepID=UPI0025CD881C|nr:phage tail protein [Halodesulfovibrio sp.]MCT4533767.1 phage tail protein [Halodesulfovibrio sp.]
MKKRFVRISIYVLVTLAIIFAVSFANADDATSFNPTAVTVKAEPTGLAIGSVVAWSRSSVPQNYLRCNGQSFSTSTYPKLYAALGSSRVPNYDGEFLRGAGGSRGSVGSLQGDAIRNITGSFSSDNIEHHEFLGDVVNGDGAMVVEGKGSKLAVMAPKDGKYSGYGARAINFDASNVVPTASENRPRNIAVMYIIRAK